MQGVKVLGDWESSYLAWALLKPLLVDQPHFLEHIATQCGYISLFRLLSHPLMLDLSTACCSFPPRNPGLWGCKDIYAYSILSMRFYNIFIIVCITIKREMHLSIHTYVGQKILSVLANMETIILLTAYNLQNQHTQAIYVRLNWEFPMQYIFWGHISTAYHSQ